jgi:hypothetical protein
MKKHITLLFFFVISCVAGLVIEMDGLILISALAAGYCCSKIQYLHSKRYKIDARPYLNHN